MESHNEVNTHVTNKHIHTMNEEAQAIVDSDLSGSKLRGALRKAVRDTGESGRWISYARNDELISFLSSRLVPHTCLQRIAEEDEAKAQAEAKAKAKAEAEAEAEAEERALAELAARKLREEIEHAKVSQAASKVSVNEPHPVDRAIEDVKKAGIDVSFEIPKKDPLYYRTGAGKVIEWHLHACRPLIVTGPSGSGKTFPIEQECGRLGRRVLRVNFNGGVLPSTFMGRWTAKAGATVFNEGLLPLAMRFGIVVLGDEFDFAPAEISACFHPAMEATKGHAPSIYIPDTHTRIEAVDGFVVILTCNSMGDETGVYSGTSPINGAITTRASRVTVDYPSVSEEAAILRKVGADKAMASALAKAMKDLRKAHFVDSTISLPPSLRQSVRIAEMASTGCGKAAPMPLWMAARCTLVEGMTGQEMSTAEEILQRHGILSEGGPTFNPDDPETKDVE